MPNPSDLDIIASRGDSAPIEVLIRVAESALKTSKDRAGLVDQGVNWFGSVFGGADKWAPLERELAAIKVLEAQSEGGHSVLLNQRAGSLLRSLGVDVPRVEGVDQSAIDPELQKGRADAGDAAPRAEEGAARLPSSPGSLLDMIPRPVLVGGVTLVLGSIVGGPLGFVIGAGGVAFAWWDGHKK